MIYKSRTLCVTIGLILLSGVQANVPVTNFVLTTFLNLVCSNNFIKFYADLFIVTSNVNISDSKNLISQCAQSIPTTFISASLLDKMRQSNTILNGNSLILLIAEDSAGLEESLDPVDKGLLTSENVTSSTRSSFMKQGTYILVWSELSANPESSIRQLLSKATLELRQSLTLNSLLYFVMPRSLQEFQYFEAYFLNNQVLAVHELDLNSIGNTVVSRMDLHGLTITATAPRGNLTQGEIIWGETMDGTGYFEGGSVALPTDGWASLFPNGSWMDGMAKEVNIGKADIGLAKTSMLPYRAEAFTYLQPIHTLIVTAFFKQPDVSAGNIFLKPFGHYLWLCILSTWAIVLVSIILLNRINPRRLRSATREDSPSSNLYTLLWIFSALCQRGLNISPTLLSYYIIIILGEALGIVVFVAYSASLVSIFASPEPPIKSIQDLLQSDIRLIVDVNNAGARLVVSKTSAKNSPITNRLISRVSDGGKNAYISAPNATAIIDSENIAFMTFSDTFYTTLKNIHQKSDKYLCDRISSVPVATIPFRSGLFVSKDSPYKQLFNVKILTQFSSGLMSRYVSSYERTYVPICNHEFQERASPKLEMTHLYSAFVLLGSGIGLSLLVIICEFFQSRLDTVHFVESTHLGRRVGVPNMNNGFGYHGITRIKR